MASMGLVAYPDSDSDSNQSSEILSIQNESPSKPETRLPALPSNFLDSYSTTVRSSDRDDPALHQGRQRITPHVDGDWPTHVYLEWSPTEEETALIERLTVAYNGQLGGQAQIQSLLKTELGVPVPLHISLSAPIALSTDQRDRFIEELSAAVASSKCYPFATSLLAPQLVSNELATRWFLVLGVDQSHRGQLDVLLQLTNRTAARFGQPMLYADGTLSLNQFHISIGWASSDQSAAFRRLEESMDIQNLVCDLTQLGPPRYTCMKVKIGNMIRTIDFSIKENTSSSVFD